MKDYEDKHIHLPKINTIDTIKLKMDERGIKPKDLENIIGTKGHVSSILSGRREVTLKWAQKLKDYLQCQPKYFYIQRLKIILKATKRYAFISTLKEKGNKAKYMHWF